MTELVKNQGGIILIMTGCGLGTGLVQDIFKEFICIRRLSAAAGVLMELFSWVVTGFMASEFLYYCDKGKLSFTGIVCFIAGLWLWKRMFCDILTLTGEENGKEKRTNKRIP